MKKVILAVLLALCAFVFAACGSSQEHFDSPENADALKATAPAQSATATPTPYVTPYDYDTGDYDPTQEEGISGLPDDEEEPVEVVIPAATPVSVNSEFAGQPPLQIDPINKPTPTPVPTVEYAESDFTVYDATRLRISFEAPAGWDVDESIADSYIITNPDERLSYKPQLMLTARGVSSSYNQSALQREVNAVLEALKSDYTNFSPSSFGSRTLLSASGAYKDFTATIKGTDIQIWGRVQAVYHANSKTLIVLRLTAPLEYKALYKDTVYPRFRKTLKFTR